MTSANGHGWPRRAGLYASDLLAAHDRGAAIELEASQVRACRSRGTGNALRPAFPLPPVQTAQRGPGANPGNARVVDLSPGLRELRATRAGAEPRQRPTCRWAMVNQFWTAQRGPGRTPAMPITSARGGAASRTKHNEGRGRAPGNVHQLHRVRGLHPQRATRAGANPGNAAQGPDQLRAGLARATRARDEPRQRPGHPPSAGRGR